MSTLKRFRPAAFILIIPTIYYCYSPKEFLLNSHSWTPYTISTKEQVSPSTYKLTLIPNHPQNVPLPKDIHHIQIMHPLIQVQRSYTPVSSDPLTFLIKNYKDGEVSRYITSLSPGGELNLRGPIVDYIVPQTTEITFIVGGTGITPALQLANARPDIKVHIVHAHHKDDFKATDLPQNVRYTSITRTVQPSDLKLVSPVVVCGPDGFLEFICGPKNLDGSQGEVLGLLKDSKCLIWKL